MAKKEKRKGEGKGEKRRGKEEHDEEIETRGEEREEEERGEREVEFGSVLGSLRLFLARRRCLGRVQDCLPLQKLKYHSFFIICTIAL